MGKANLLAENKENRHASMEFSVPESNVRLWWKHKDAILIVLPCIFVQV
jgi:hypothetical protein